MEAETHMNATTLFILAGVIILIVLAILAFVLGRREAHNRITPLTGLAFAFVIAGIVFGADRLIGYSLMGIGVIMAIYDMLRRPK